MVCNPVAKVCGKAPLTAGVRNIAITEFIALQVGH